jgi:uncharacterized protein
MRVLDVWRGRLMPVDPTDLLIIVVAIAAGSFVKGVTGSGLPQIAIPVIAVFLGVERAVVLMVVPGIVSNTWLLWTYRRHLSRTRDLPVLLATGTVGAILGTWLLQELDGRILSGVLAAIIVTYVVLRLTRPTFALQPATTRVLSPPVGFAAGTLQGATGISGPLLTTYLHGYRYEAPVFVVSLVLLFQVFAVVQGVALVGVGLLTWPRALEGVVALVPMALALPLGTRVARRLPTERFDRWILVILVASALALLRGAIVGG